MNTKQTLALVSTSTLAAGMAQGAVVYSGQLNLQQLFNSSDALSRQAVNMTGGTVPDFTFGYEAGVATKPYVDARTYVSPQIPTQSGLLIPLSKVNQGLPITPAGTMIDASYAATYPGKAGDPRAYMFNDGNNNPAGDWSGTAITDAFVGIELALPGGTRYGWLHFKDDPTAATPSLTLEDWAYESTAGVGIATVLVPEPSTLALGGIGAAALLALRRRK